MDKSKIPVKTIPVKILKYLLKSKFKILQIEKICKPKNNKKLRPSIILLIIGINSIFVTRNKNPKEITKDKR